MPGSRIQGGQFKGRKIGSVPGKMPTRPILARIKKSLFDILKTRLADSAFLDLFSGSGSVGLEALSRGARRVVFIDANPECQKWIQGNLKAFKGGSDIFANKATAEVYRADVTLGLAWLSEQFDIVFSGAPYVDAEKRPLFFVKDILEIIQRDKILKDTGLFIAQHHAKETVVTPTGWDFFRQEEYGDTFLSFFRPMTYARKD